MKKAIFSTLLGVSLLGGTVFAEDSIENSSISQAEVTQESSQVIIKETSSSEPNVESTSSSNLNQDIQSNPEINYLEKKIEVSSVEEVSKPTFGVTKSTQVAIYENIDDAVTKINPVEKPSLYQSILEIDSVYTVAGEKYYHVKAVDGTMYFILKEDLTYSEMRSYITFQSSKDVSVFTNTKLENPISSKKLSYPTYEVTQEIKVGQETYYTLFDTREKTDNFIGFVNKKAVNITTNAQGTYQTFNRYVTLTNKNQNIYQNFDFKVRENTSSYSSKTMYAKGRYFHNNGVEYYSLYDNKDKWLGYIESSKVSLANGKQGSALGVSEYATVVSANYPIWQNFSWKQKSSSALYKGKVVQVRNKYNHFNGSTYLSMFDSSGKWLGYINQNGTKKDSGAQGTYQTYGKYVTVRKSGYDIWQNFNWNKKSSRKAEQNKTYLAKGKYQHFNGQTYLSLYDNKGQWRGYINAKGVNVASGQQGTYQSFGKYVTVTKPNYNTWQNFSWKKKDSSNNLRTMTLKATGIYRHYNGSEYYSLHDKNNKWYGYINKNGVTLADGPQGVYQHYGKDVTITKDNYPVWRGFDWKKKNTSQTFKNKKFRAKGIYKHFNGSSYYSIYSNNVWLGYINTAAAQSYNMNQLIPDQKSLMALQLVVQQKILDNTSNSNNVIDKVLAMSMINRGNVTFNGSGFTVDLKSKGVGTNSVNLSYQEIAPAVNYNLLPQDEVRKVIKPLDSKKKYVALTFDDGPNAVTTPQLLNILKRKNVKATFFALGQSVNSNRSVAKRIVSEGHQIASHSYSHPQLTQLSTSSIQQQMRSADKAIYQATGVLPKAFRPPYGAVNSSVANAIRKPSIIWDVDTRDWESRNPASINSIVNSQTRNGSIILMHDIHQPTINSVSQMIDNLRNKGYTFVTVEELYAYKLRPMTNYYSKNSFSGF